MNQKKIKFISAAAIALALSISGPLAAQNMVNDEGQEGLLKTISYDVSKFTDIRDKKLQDVMQKMPGLNYIFGSFDYNGKMIVKYYINGLDVLEGNNTPVYDLKPEDVEKLEIQENHVVIQVLRGIQYSDGVSINVVLKDSAKGKWSGSMKGLAGGTPLIGTADINGLSINSRQTTTFSIKADNTGQVLSTSSSDYDSFDGGFGGGFSGGFGSSSGNGFNMEETGIAGDFDNRVKSFLTVVPSMAPLAQERVRFNRSTALNLGTTYKLNDNYQLNLQLGLSTDRLTASSYEEKTYYQDQGSEGILDVTGENSKKHQYRTNASITLLSNTSEKYLKNTLDFTGEWMDMAQNITGTYANYNKNESKPLTISDNLSYKHAFGKNVLNILFKASYNTRPQNLLVEKENTNFFQDISTSSAYVDLGARYDIKLSDQLTLAFNAGGSGNFRSLKTDMKTNMGNMPDNLDASINIYNAFSGAKVTYITDNLQAELSLPVVLGNYNQKNNVSHKSSSESKVFFSPSLSLKYEASRNLSLSLMANVMDKEVDRKKIYPGMVLQTFRRANMGYPEVLRLKTTMVNLGATYRLPSSSFFINGNLSQTWTKDPFISNFVFDNDLIISGYEKAPADYKSTYTMATVDINKGITSLKGKIGLSVSYTRYEDSKVRNNITFKTGNTGWTIAPYINGRLTSWLNAVYQLRYNTSRMSITGAENATTSKSYTQSLELIISPWQKLNFSFLGEHYYTEFSDNESKHLALLDFKAEYKLSDKVQLLLTATNLLNQKTYNYTLISSTEYTKSYTAFDIRPRNILVGVYYKF